MDEYFDNETVVVQPDHPPVNAHVPNSNTASRRTIAKYLKRKFAMTKLINETDINLPEKGFKTVEDEKNNTIAAELNEKSLSKSSDSVNSVESKSLPTYLNENKKLIDESLINNINIDNINPINNMLKCVLEGRKCFPDTFDKLNEVGCNWNLANQINKFENIQPDILSSSLSESIDSQEREIAYNLLLRKVVDETLDRSVIYSHQPKEILNMINSMLVRQFPEYDINKHPCKVRSYLKACRRNSKKNNGKIIMKNTAAYLSSGPGNRLMLSIYRKEKDYIEKMKKESEKIKMTFSGVSSQVKNNTPGSFLSSSNDSTQSGVVPIGASQSLIIQAKYESNQTIKSLTTATLPTIVSAAAINSVANTNMISTSGTGATYAKLITPIYTTRTPLNVTKLPILLPNNVGTEHTIRGVVGKSESETDLLPSTLVDALKMLIKENTSQNQSTKTIIDKLKETANFMNTLARVMEKITN